MGSASPVSGYHKMSEWLGLSASGDLQPLELSFYSGIESAMGEFEMEYPWYWWVVYLCYQTVRAGQSRGRLSLQI